MTKKTISAMRRNAYYILTIMVVAYLNYAIRAVKSTETALNS